MRGLALGALAGGAWLAVGGVALADDVACDAFNAYSYTIGGDVYPAGGVGPDDGLGWTGGWQGSSGNNITAARTVAPALTYPGLDVRGNAAASPAYVGAGANSTAVRAFANPGGPVVWFSFLIQLNSADVMANGNSAGNYGGIALEDASGSHFLYVGVPGGATGYSLQTNAAIAPHGSATPSVGKTDLLVMRLDGNQRASLWVDPTLGQALGAPDAVIAVPLAAAAYTALYWSDSWGWTYGDVRIGTTLAAVTTRHVVCPARRRPG